MTAFADASAVAKIYLDEDHSDLARTLVDVVVSGLSRVEVVGALWRREHLGLITTGAARDLATAFAVDWTGSEQRAPRFLPVVVDERVLDTAAAIVARHDLRAGDAIQLACATTARIADPSCSTFVCFDRRLRDAAAREGFALLPPEL